jgi:hypothetical protein
MNLLLVLQLFSCFSLTGLIWLVQLVHYPSFTYVEEKGFDQFAKFHADKISFIVVPLMILDLLSAVMLASQYGWLNVALLVIVFLSTAVWSVPCHKKLQMHGKDLKCIKKLVLTNWPRTIIWTVRSLIWCFVLLQV